MAPEVIAPDSFHTSHAFSLLMWNIAGCLENEKRRRGDLNSRGAEHQWFSRPPPSRTRLPRPECPLLLARRQHKDICQGQSVQKGGNNYIPPGAPLRETIMSSTRSSISTASADDWIACLLQRSGSMTPSLIMSTVLPVKTFRPKFFFPFE